MVFCLSFSLFQNYFFAVTRIKWWKTYKEPPPIGNIMKLLVLFFSGTGNTQFIAEYIKAHLLLEKHPTNLEITMAALEGFDPQMLLDYDSLVLGFPIYAGLPPVNLLDRYPKLLINVPLSSIQRVWLKVSRIGMHLLDSAKKVIVLWDSAVF